MPRLSVVILLALVAAACGGGDDASVEESPSTTSIPDSTDSSPGEPTDGEAVASGDGDVGEATDDDPSVPESQPAIWTETALGEFPDFERPETGFWPIGDEIWFATFVGSSSMVMKSNDDGRTFTEVTVEPPPSGGAFQQSRIKGFVDDGAGTIVGWGERGRGCRHVGEVAGRPFARECSRFSAVIHLSTDGGVTWEQFEPPTMAAPGDSNMRLPINAVTYHAGGFVAVATVQGPDWHGRVYSSADGRTWELSRELRSDRASVSVEQVHSDRTTLLVHASEHTCAFDGSPNRGGPTWYLGAGVPSDPVVYLGTSVDDLALLSHADLELVPAPREVDCTAIDSVFMLGQEPFPSLAIHDVSGRLVIFDRSKLPEPEEGEDDSDEEPTTTRRWATLDDDGWTTTSVDGITHPSNHGLRSLITIGGELGILEYSRRFWGPLITLSPVVSDETGSWNQIDLPPLAGTEVLAVVGFDGAILVATDTRHDPESPGDAASAELTIHRYGDPPDNATCDLRAGGSCRFARLDLVEGYPDFTGRDLTGIDLSYSDLADADFTDSVFDDATMRGVVGTDASLGGVSLRNADLTHAQLSDVGGADLTGADLANADLEISAPPVLTGANLTGASIDALASEIAIELSLAGLDLESSRVSGHWDSPLVVITDLTGAVVSEYTYLSYVDLTDTILGDVDITVPRVWDNSICPGGAGTIGEGVSNCPTPG